MRLGGLMSAQDTRTVNRWWRRKRCKKRWPVDILCIEYIGIHHMHNIIFVLVSISISVLFILQAITWHGLSRSMRAKHHAAILIYDRPAKAWHCGIFRIVESRPGGAPSFVTWLICIPWILVLSTTNTSYMRGFHKWGMVYTGKSHWKGMMLWGSPISGNPHISSQPSSPVRQQTGAPPKACGTLIHGLPKAWGSSHWCSTGCDGLCQACTACSGRPQWWRLGMVELGLLVKSLLFFWMMSMMLPGEDVTGMMLVKYWMSWFSGFLGMFWNSPLWGLERSPSRDDPWRPWALPGAHRGCISICRESYWWLPGAPVATAAR